MASTEEKPDMSIDSRGSRCQDKRVNDMPLRGAGGLTCVTKFSAPGPMAE